MTQLKLISCEENGDVISLKALEYNGKADLSKAPVMIKMQEGANNRF